MAKPEWGTKRNCPKCNSKFYDLQKNPANCPICGFSYDTTATVKKRKGRSKAVTVEGGDAAKLLAVAVKAQKKKKKAGEKDEESIGLPEFEDLDVIEDMDDLADMGDVEVLTPKDEDEVDEEALLEKGAVLEDDADEDEEDDK